MVAVYVLLLAVGQRTTCQESNTKKEKTTKVVMLGVGNPNADPDRSGPAVAVIAGGKAYLVDCGPGVVRRAAAAEKKDDIPALKSTELGIVFITHLHSDHTLGYPDLIFT